MVGELIKRCLEERPFLGKLFTQRRILRRLIRREVTESETQLLGPVTGRLIDSELEEMVRRKKEEWLRRGVRPGLADKAAELAREWAERIARWHVEHLRDVVPEEELARIEKEILKKYLQEGLNRVAERWIEAFMYEKL